MANLYWVGGAANTNWTENTGAVSNWAGASGGATAGAIPTSADDVFFDANSGAGTATINTGAVCKAIDMTGFTGTLASSDTLGIYGGMTLGAATWTLSATHTFNFLGTATRSISAANFTIPSLTVNGAATYLTCTSNVVISGALTITQGTFDADGYDITAGSLGSTNSNTRTIKLAAGTWTITGTGASIWDTTVTTGLTFNATGGTVNFSGAAPQIATGNITFTTANFTHAGTAAVVTGNWTCSVACAITGAGVVTITDGNWNVASFTKNSSTVTFTGTTNVSITTNSSSFYNVTINLTWPAEIACNDDLGLQETLTLTEGLLNCNGNTVSVNKFSSNNANNREVDISSHVGGFVISGGSGTVWDTTTSTNFTLWASTPMTAKLSFTGAGASAKTIAGGGVNFSVYTTIDGDNYVITGDNTFLFLSLLMAGEATGLKVTSGSTQTFGDFVTDGYAGNLVKISSSVASNAFTFTKPSGVVEEDYLSLTDSTAAGGATWYAGLHSIDGGGNTGWIFTDAPSNLNDDNIPKSSQEVLNAIFDTSANALCVFSQNANPPTTQLSKQEILNRVYNSTTNSLLTK